jgi:hypothetical protein
MYLKDVAAKIEKKIPPATNNDDHTAAATSDK